MALHLTGQACHPSVDQGTPTATERYVPVDLGRARGRSGQYRRRSRYGSVGGSPERSNTGVCCRSSVRRRSDIVPDIGRSHG